MKAYILKSAEKICEEEIPVPRIKEDQVLIRMLGCGMCHSELADWMRGSSQGTILGHEPVGIVEKTGRLVRDFLPGDRVTGLFQHCFAEYTAAPQELVLKVPDGLQNEEAVGEPWSCLLSGADRMNLRLGDTAAVVGCGFMGLGVIELLKLMGAGKVIAVDLRKESLDWARRMGADEVYFPDQIPGEYVVDRWDDRIFLRGVDVAVEASGSASGLTLAGRLVKPHGTVGIVGYHQNPAGRVVDMQLWNWKAVTVVNAHERRVSCQMEYMRRALRLIETGKLKALPLITHRYQPKDLNQAFEAVREKPENYIKGYVDFR